MSLTDAAGPVDELSAVYGRMSGLVLSEQAVDSGVRLATSLAVEIAADPVGAGVSLFDESGRRETRAASVRAAQRPPVGVDAQLVGSTHEPRFDRDDQARPEAVAATRTTVVGHVRIAVHRAPDTVSTELDVDGQPGNTELKKGIGDRSTLPLTPILVTVGCHQHCNNLFHTPKPNPRPAGPNAAG